LINIIFTSNISSALQLFIPPPVDDVGYSVERFHTSVRMFVFMCV